MNFMAVARQRKQIDMTIAPVSQDRTEDLYGRVVPLQAQQARNFQKAGRGWKWFGIGALSVCFIKELVVPFITPVERPYPAFVYLDKFNVQNTANLISELPLDRKSAGVDALMWQYLSDREHYSPSEADQSYSRVSAMSVETVKQQYQKYANPGVNSKAPAKLLGKTGFIRVYPINSAFLSHAEDYSSGVYQIHFCRVVAPEGQSATAQRMVASMSYQVVEAVPVWQRLHFNYLGVMITEYPGAQVEGSDAKLQIIPGGDNPCVN